MAERQDLAIVGMACRFPGADDVDEFWDNLLDGRDTISRATADHDGADRTFVSAVGKLTGVELFDADYFKIAPGEAVSMDPQQRLLLEVAVAAMEDAGYGGEQADGTDPVVGVFVGGGEAEYLHEFVAPATGRDPYNDLRLRTGNGKDFLAARLAFKLGLTGPSLTIQAGCATGLVAVATACNALLAGDCDVAVAGGVSLVMPDVDGYEFESGSILSADGLCRPFDALASGTVPSSGVGVVVLKRDDDAVRDRDCRRAIVRGWAVNNDGGSRSGFTVPNITGQARAIRRALERADLSSPDVGFLETHGTATAIGDAVEIEALKQVFGDAGTPPCALGAVKANIGHTDAAAGIAGLIKSVLVVERGMVPPLVNFTELNDGIDLEGSPFVVPTKAAPWARPGKRVAGVSSFGLGGNNSHVIVCEAPVAHGEEPPGPTQVIALSARSPEQLEQLRTSTARWFEDRAPMAGAALADAAFTLAAGRQRLQHRWAASVDDAEAAVRALTAPVRPVQPTSRYELTVAGSTADLCALDRGELAVQPTYQAALARLLGELDRASAPLSEVERAALTVLATVRTLDDLGLTFARIDGPAWLRPALAWHVSGDDRALSLAEAMQACVAAEASVPRAGLDGDATGPVTETAPGRVLMDSAFSLSATIAAAWEWGAPVRLERLHGGQARYRAPMPTYPFRRLEYWVPRSTRLAVSEDSDPDDTHDGTGDGAGDGASEVSDLVSKVWREVLGLEEIDPEAHFVDDLGGDSMYAVEIGGQLNDELGLDLPIDLPFEAPTINQAVAAVAAALSGEGTDS